MHVSRYGAEIRWICNLHQSLGATAQRDEPPETTAAKMSAGLTLAAATRKSTSQC